VVGPVCVCMVCNSLGHERNRSQHYNVVLLVVPLYLAAQRAMLTEALGYASTLCRRHTYVTCALMAYLMQNVGLSTEAV